jgi:hypothetical protein
VIIAQPRETLHVNRVNTNPQTILRQRHWSSS